MSEHELAAQVAARAGGTDDIPSLDDPAVIAGASAVGRLRRIFGGVLPDDVTITRAVLGAANKYYSEAAAAQRSGRTPHVEHPDR